MNVFIYSTYKNFIKAFITHNGTRGIVSQIAGACGCDRTYISQVLNGKAELTPDHMVQFCETFGFNEAESNFLMQLLLRDRSSSIKARKLMEAKLKRIKTEALALSQKVFDKEKVREIPNELRTLYYSNWMYGAVHTLTSIKEYQSPSAIAQKIHVPVLTATQILKDLVEMRLVRSDRGIFVHSGEDIYLARQSPQISAHHLGWRMKAVERSLEKKDIHYTLAFSVSESDVENLRSQIVELIESQRKLVHSSGAEVACAFCVDFFGL